MATIQIKRGAQIAVETLVLTSGEIAVALDTGNVYIGTETGKIHINPKGGTSDDTIKLKTARTFSATGDAVAAGVSFDGTQNVALAMSLATMTGLTAGTYTKLTVDTKGRVTGASSITLTDLPSIPTTKITGLGAAATMAVGTAAGTVSAGNHTHTPAAIGAANATHTHVNTDITGLGSAATKNTGTASGNVVLVESSGKIADSLIPSLAISDCFEAASQAAMLALTAQVGDICVRSDESKTYILSASPAATLANWKWLKTPDCKILSVNGKTGAVTLSAADVGASATSHTHTAAAVGAAPAAHANTIASTAVLGHIKVGKEFAIDASGALSIATIDGGTF